MRRRILLLVVGMTVLVVLAFAIPLAILIRSNAYNDGLDGLRKEATGIAYTFLRGENSTKTAAQIKAYLADLDQDRRASVQLPKGTIVGDAPPGPLDSLPALPQYGRGGALGGAGRSDGSGSGGAGVGDPGRAGAPGDTDVTAMSYAGGQLVQLRVPAFTFNAGGGFGGGAGSGVQPPLYTVRVYADNGTLRSGQTGPLLLLGGASIGLLLLGVALGELLTRRIVAPLVNTSETAQRLAAGDVTARATTSGPPEIADVGLALNRLADRIDQLIAEERETVADMSHRLRTPLTALRLDAEALSDPVDAERLGGHVSTLERMLTAVIHAARRPQREGRIPACDATAVVGERVAFWSALAEDQERVGTVDLPAEPLPVRAGAEDLAAAVDALMENVIAHTPEGTAYAVTLVATPAGADLTIADDGRGLPDEAPVRGRSDRGSSGLGLDIARRCAEASGGSMSLGSSPSGGAFITLRLAGP